MKLSAYFIMILITGFQTYGQNAASSVSTVDIDNFWIAYDSIRSTSDSMQQLQYIQKLYIDKGTQGLHAFMEARDYSAGRWVMLINRYPKFWNSIRPHTLAVQSKAKLIDSSIARLQLLYPSLRPAHIYFTIGGLRSGGTTTNDMVLIGTEIATGTAAT